VAVRTRSFAAVVVSPLPGLTTLYTVPPDRTAIVKYLTMWSNLGGGLVFYLVRGGVGKIWLVQGLAGGEAKQFSPWLVMVEGDELVLQAGAGIEPHITVSGALLQGDPS